jgi:DNA-binding MarR family transcriptional regulator
MPESNSPLFKERTDELMWRVCKVAELFRVKDTEVPGQLVSVFCYIASHNPCNLQAISEALGMSHNSTSRNTDWLSSHHRLGKSGMGLIVKYTDPLNLRRKVVKLTPKGEQMIINIKEILYGHQETDLVG